jgi:CheY-like chemotaxis protein
MRNRVLRVLGAAALALSMVIGGLVAVSMPSTARAGQTTPEQVPEQVRVGQQVVIVLRGGGTVTGELVEETATEYRVRVRTMLSETVRTISKAEVSAISRAPDAQPAAGTTIGGQPAGTQARTRDPSKKLVFVIPFTGALGHDVTPRPLRRALQEAKRAEADIIIFDMNMAFVMQGREVEDLFVNHEGTSSAYALLDTARELDTVMTDEIRDDPTWVKKPQTVVWVRRALGPPAFLVLPFRDIFFHPNARMGGIGHLEQMAEGRADNVVTEKWRGMMLAMVVGLANKGGHDRRLIEAMCRTDYRLSYSMEGGRPVYYEMEHADRGEFVLTNGGKPQDSLEDIARFTGRNVLTLDAPLAKKLGVSRGTADSIERLLFEMGIERDYEIDRDTAERVFKNWQESVRRAEQDAMRLWREFQNVQVNGATASQRNSQRMRQIGFLRQIKQLLAQYGEAFRREAIPVGGTAVGWDVQINIIIDRLQAQIRNDRDGGGGGGGVGGGGGPRM